MKNHILRIRLKTHFLLFFIGITFLQSFSNQCFAQVQKPSDIYKAYIKQADLAFNAEDYEAALPLYEKANEVKPEYNYATDRISEIRKILDASPESKAQLAAQKKSTDASYKTFLAKADWALANMDYAGALLLYEKAYQTRPDYYYASDRIDEVNTILSAAPDTKSQLYNKLIQKADSLYKKKNYQLAKSEYQKASLVDSSAQLPKARLEQISSVYVDPDDMANYNLAIASGDKALAMSHFEQATLFYEAALAIHPNVKFVKGKITETQQQQAEYKEKSGQLAVNAAAADIPLQSPNPAETADSKEKPEPVKTNELHLSPDQQKYDAAISGAENLLKSFDYEGALAGFKSASAIKPAETYPLQKISEIEAKLADSKSMDEKYASAIASGDKLLSESKYKEALSAYNQALSVKPNEAYPINKTAEINSILAKQKSDADNYAQAIRTGEKAKAAGNYSLALASFEEARKIKPSEVYTMEQINEIKAETTNQQKKEDKYTAAIKTGDKLLAEKEYNGAIKAYNEAVELKNNEKYPLDQIVKINKIIADSRTDDDNYALAIAEGDKLFATKDYSGAITAFNKATALKPAETYPKQRIIEINTIIAGIASSHTSEYTKALEVADKLYNTKVYDQAIEAYEAAAKINPGDAYPELQIGKIRKYISEHTILDLNSQSLTISKGDEKKFTFSAIDPSQRKNNYILIKVRSTGNSAPKVYLNYGKNDQKNGGIVLRNLDKSTISDLLISISIQDKWFREDNNWISLSVETGDIEITKVQIAAGE